MNAYPDMIQRLLDERPRDAEGRPLCGCGVALAESELTCQACRAENFRRAEIAAENAMLENAKNGAIMMLRARWAWVENDAEYHAAVKSPKARAIAERYSLDAGNLVVLGATGKGKSASVNRALRRIVRAAQSRRDVPRIVWTTGPEIMRARFEQRMGAPESDLIAEARAASVLVLDEWGFERLEQPFWTDFVDARYGGTRRTLVTSGASLDELRERYGAATIRKLVEPVGATVDLGA